MQINIEAKDRDYLTEIISENDWNGMPKVIVL